MHTLKSLINEQGGYVVLFLFLSKYSFIRDFRVHAQRSKNLERYLIYSGSNLMFTDLVYCYTNMHKYPFDMRACVEIMNAGP